VQNRILTKLAFAAGAVFVIACGGGGILGLGETVSLRANPSTISYGGASEIRWSRSEQTSFYDANFGVPSNLNSGSITDRPNSTVTYRLRVRNDETNNLVDATVTVTVAKTQKRYVIVGSPSHAEVPQIDLSLRMITEVPVVIQTSFPTDPSTYDVVVLHGSGLLSPSDNTRVQTALAQGKGVVVIGESVSSIAGGFDLSGVGSWFGATGSMSSWDDPVRGTPGDVLLPATILNRSNSASTDFQITATSLAPTAEVIMGDLSRAGAFAYRPTIGGKVGFVQAPYGDEPIDHDVYGQVFRGLAQWASH